MSAETKDVSYLDEVAGQGFESMGGDETTVPRLLISQQLSQSVQDGSIQAGHFYNSVTGKDYGTSLDVIVCHFSKVWIAWKPNGGGYVGTYQVGSIEVTGDNFSGMKDKEGNDVTETWAYLVILPEHLEDGYLVFQSTRGNLKYLKSWNTQMKFLRTPSGKPAPLFSAIWNLTLGKDTNKKGQTYYSCNVNGKSSAVHKDWVPGSLFTEYVSPAREIATQAIALTDNRTNIEAIESDETSY